MPEKKGLPLYLLKRIHRLQEHFNSRAFTANEARKILPSSKSYQYFVLFKLVRAGLLRRFGPGVYQVAKAIEEPRISVYLSDVEQKIKKHLLLFSLISQILSETRHSDCVTIKVR